MHHREHLYLAWSLCRAHDPETALRLIREAIRGWASQHGQATKYHETLTRFWVRMVAHVMQQRPEIADFEELLGVCPHLLDTQLPYHYWRQETLYSDEARAAWVAPDRQRLPDDATG